MISVFIGMKPETIAPGFTAIGSPRAAKVSAAACRSAAAMASRFASVAARKSLLLAATGESDDEAVTARYIPSFRCTLSPSPLRGETVKTRDWPVNGELFQLIALACDVNAALAGNKLRVAPDHAAYRFCRSISFVTLEENPSGEWQESIVAATPDLWIESLFEERAVGAALTLGPRDDEPLAERIATAFAGGGGDWALEIELPGNIRQKWIARWEAGERHASDDKIWRVTYGCIDTSPGPPHQPPDLAAASDELERALVAIRSFAKRQGHLDNFIDTFETALKCLAAPPGRPAYPLDSYMQILAPRAANLLQAAECAWVFGGMGSWNDMGFEGAADIEYQRVSDDLYVAINGAILAAVNNSLGPKA
ncbi:hypothetical protein [Pseudolabrys sp. FHR47]|uniref:hypothetical protein n=1 Tax=Pseudolabrys sp. FHR47 TaxID=2562284 RepID=UPI00197E57C7|nr:hypothetical protein [Pseudolabrys sp. FHR47]